jgi:hypothetical protein
MSNLTAPSPSSRTGIISRVLALALLAAFILLPNVARADTDTTYNITGSTLTGGTFSGSLEFDASASGTQLINSSFTLDGISFACNGASSNTCVAFNPFGTGFFQVMAPNSFALLQWDQSGFNFLNPPATFNFTGGYCLGCGFLGIGDIITGGKATVATPEPSSLILLGAGLFALALISRRKLGSSYNAA